jgi:non-canonical poly(A) RNA polymerase PAPD5/7
MPPLKPLTFVLKYFMAARGLNEPYSGGCGSFMLQMMIVSFLQHRERQAYNNRQNHAANTMNLGSMLLEFFELYGMDFNYLTTGISVRSDGYYFPKGAKGRKEHFHQSARPFSLAIENPFDITADVGKGSFRMQLIAKSFEVAMRVLLSHTAEPVVATQSILASILPPTEEMYKRATMSKVLKIEQNLSNNNLSSNADKNQGSNDMKKHTRYESSGSSSDEDGMLSA